MLFWRLFLGNATPRRDKIPSDSDSRANLLELARETREKIQEIIFVMQHFAGDAGTLAWRRRARAKESIAGLRRVYWDTRETFEKTDAMRRAMGERILAQFQVPERNGV